MKKIFLTLLVFSVSVSLFAQSLKQQAFFNTRFAWKMYGLIKEKQAGNFVFSPYGITSAMAMLYAGARGATAESIKSGMYYIETPPGFHSNFSALNTQYESMYTGESGALFKQANSIWVRDAKEVKIGFVDTLAKYYAPSVFPLTTADEINKWVEEKTEKKIKDFIKEDEISQAEMVLLNANYLDAKWMFPFEASRTSKRTFYTEGGREIQVPTMVSPNVRCIKIDNDNFEAIEMPYKNEGMVFGIILPKKGVSLSYVEASITELQLQTLFPYNEDFMFSDQIQILQVELPSFSCTTEMELKELLAKAGMSTAFNENNFSGMMDGVFIGKIKQKAFIEVNEEGTVAGSATIITVERGEPEKFQVNRPFFFYIRDSVYGSFFFMGRIVDPSAK